MAYKTYCGRCGAGLINTVFRLEIVRQETGSAGVDVHSTSEVAVLCDGCMETAKEALRGIGFKIPR